MTVELWPCDQCGNPGVRNVAARGYCAAHLHALYATFHPAAFAHGGIGLPLGELRPEYGPLEADLECCKCGATWSGLPGDNCGWCRRQNEIGADMQAEALLRAPEIDPADTNYDQRIGAWAQRMKIGVDAGLIDEEQAERAYARATKSKPNGPMPERYN